MNRIFQLIPVFLVLIFLSSSNIHAETQQKQELPAQKILLAVDVSASVEGSKVSTKDAAELLLALLKEEGANADSEAVVFGNDVIVKDIKSISEFSFKDNKTSLMDALEVIDGKIEEGSQHVIIMSDMYEDRGKKLSDQNIDEMRNKLQEYEEKWKNEIDKNNLSVCIIKRIREKKSIENKNEVEIEFLPQDVLKVEMDDREEVFYQIINLYYGLFDWNKEGMTKRNSDNSPSIKITFNKPDDIVRAICYLHSNEQLEDVKMFANSNILIQPIFECGSDKVFFLKQNELQDIVVENPNGKGISVYTAELEKPYLRIIGKQIKKEILDEAVKYKFDVKISRNKDIIVKNLNKVELTVREKDNEKEVKKEEDGSYILERGKTYIINAEAETEDEMQNIILLNGSIKLKVNPIIIRETKDKYGKALKNLVREEKNNFILNDMFAAAEDGELDYSKIDWEIVYEGKKYKIEKEYDENNNKTSINIEVKRGAKKNEEIEKLVITVKNRENSNYIMNSEFEFDLDIKD